MKECKMYVGMNFECEKCGNCKEVEDNGFDIEVEVEVERDGYCDASVRDRP